MPYTMSSRQECCASVALLDDDVQRLHLRLCRRSAAMERSSRLFLCARCRDQVLLCSHCDHGQRYCSRACSRVSRRERRRETAQRYQSSRGGQLKHAARTACWRQRRRSLRRSCAGGDINKVTHQGCLDAPADASLLACDTPSPCEAHEATIDTTSANNTALASAGTLQFAAPVCRRCAHPLRVHVRQGYLHTNSVRSRSGHDHPS